MRFDPQGVTSVLPLYNKLMEFSLNKPSGYFFTFFKQVGFGTTSPAPKRIADPSYLLETTKAESI